jgi:hypothetical protein
MCSTKEQLRRAAFFGNYIPRTDLPSMHTQGNQLPCCHRFWAFIYSNIINHRGKGPAEVGIGKKIEFSCAIMSQRIKGTAMRLKRR